MCKYDFGNAIDREDIERRIRDRCSVMFLVSKEHVFPGFPAPSSMGDYLPCFNDEQLFQGVAELVKDPETFLRLHELLKKASQADNVKVEYRMTDVGCVEFWIEFTPNCGE